MGDLLDEYVKYRVERNKWSLNYYAAMQRQIASYIKPSFFGKLRVQDVRVKMVEDFYTELIAHTKTKTASKRRYKGYFGPWCERDTQDFAASILTGR